MISYAVDVYQKKYAVTDLLHYATYISFFPHLIAGPIVRGNQLVPQLMATWTAKRIAWSAGMYEFAVGFVFKVLGDQISIVIDPYFTADGSVQISWLGHWIVAFLFSCHIFADFAGYSLMAIGAGRLLGYELPQNFDAPYLAGTFRGFWRRWHITLSSFLRDYLYVMALGGNRRGRLLSVVNLGLTMLLGGLWHGAAWTFVAWGGIHGGALMVERSLHIDDRIRRPMLARATWFLVVQAAVIIAWVFFRAPSLPFATTFVLRMFQPFAGPSPEPMLLGALLLTLPVIVHHASHIDGPWQLALRQRPVQGALAGVFLVVGLAWLGKPAAFIYFTF
jgi:D-alanyl-lipoteichoic acid acyltransferase DltB (MBOAT superfamily)